MNKRNLSIIAILMVILAALYVAFSGTPADKEARQESQPTANVVTPGSMVEAESAPLPVGQTIDAKEAFFMAVAKVARDRFGHRLDNPYWRMKLITDMMSVFQQEYPDTWRSELEAFFRSAFPDIAEDLIAKLASLLEYNDWLENLKGTMQFSSLEERQAALWEKRLALFGDDAYEIWEAALKNEQLQQKLKAVNEYPGNFSEKAELYRDSLREVFGDDILADDAPHKTQKMTKFLELEGVQQQLTQLPESQRYAKLREFRESLGMDEEALERWDALDQERITMWDNADTYMTQRQQLAEQYQGDELEQKLQALRVELFGETEAKYIGNEERSGYYRFANPQKIGLN